MHLVPCVVLVQTVHKLLRSLKNDETTEHANSSDYTRPVDSGRYDNRRFRAASHYYWVVDRCAGRRPASGRCRRVVEDPPQFGASIRWRRAGAERAGQADRSTSVVGQEERHVVVGQGCQQGDPIQMEQQQHGRVGQAVAGR